MSEQVIRTTITVNDASVGIIKATRREMADDGYDLYDWEWGIMGETGYDQMAYGKVTHRETDGAFTLVAKVLELIRGRKGTR